MCSLRILPGRVYFFIEVCGLAKFHAGFLHKELKSSFFGSN